MNLYRIYDCKSEEWGQPIPMQTHGVAMREFTVLANDKSQAVGQHPEDFSLWYVGSYQPDAPMIKQEIPDCLTQALQLTEN